MQQTNSRLKLFLLVQILAWTSLLGLFLWRLSAGKATLAHTIFFSLVTVAFIIGNYITLFRKLKYPLVMVPPPTETHAVPPQNVLAAEAQLVIATDLHGQVSYLNPAAARALGYSSAMPPSFFALFPENELEQAGRVATQRMTRGHAIAAACGQLRRQAEQGRLLRVVSVMNDR